MSDSAVRQSTIRRLHAARWTGSTEIGIEEGEEMDRKVPCLAS
jgi:hypothetical protein